MLSSSQIIRQTVENAEGWIPGTIERFLVERGYQMARAGCPIDDTIVVRSLGELNLWCSSQPDVLVNAIGGKDGLVDPSVAWVHPWTALASDRSHLMVAVADLYGHNLVSEPEAVDVVFVPVPGRLMPYDELSTRKTHWPQLRRHLADEVSFAAQRGEALEIHPIDIPQDQWVTGEYPSVSVWPEPGDHMHLGDGFYVFEEPERGLEPIAPYRRSALGAVADAACDVISAWGLPPIGVTTSPYYAHRGTYTIPA